MVVVVVHHRCYGSSGSSALPPRKWWYSFTLAPTRSSSRPLSFMAHFTSLHFTAARFTSFHFASLQPAHLSEQSLEGGREIQLLPLQAGRAEEQGAVLTLVPRASAPGALRGLLAGGSSNNNSNINTNNESASGSASEAKR